MIPITIVLIFIVICLIILTIVYLSIKAELRRAYRLQEKLDEAKRLIDWMNQGGRPA